MTDMLPLSGNGHAALFDLLLGPREVADPFETYVFSPCVVRMSTWIAALAFFHEEAWAALSEGLRAMRRPSNLMATKGGRDAKTIVVGSTAMLTIAWTLRDHVGPWAREPGLVGLGFLISALAVASTFWAPRGDRASPTAWGALFVGAVQGAALLPGLSRPGVALASLLWLGLRAERAFVLAFLIALPAQGVLAGSCAISSIGFPGPQAAWAPAFLVVLIATTAGVAFLTLPWVRHAAVNRSLWGFSVYLVPLAVATLAWGYARP
jgi:undecaprenyl-diphosphatase